MILVLRRYANIWLQFARYELARVWASKTSMVFFTFGKFVRFGVFMVVLQSIGQQLPSLAGYSLEQVIFFFLNYNVVDTAAQMLFRGVYSFSNKIRTGSFDFHLLHPINPLFQSLVGSPDINDVIFFVPLFALTLIYGQTHTFFHSTFQVVLYLFLLLNALVLAMALHIFVLSLAVVATQIDNAIMLYRDITQLGRFPIDLYREPIRSIFTFIIPVGIMMSTPAQSLLKGVHLSQLALITTISGVFVASSLYCWNQVLRKYTSASS